MWKVIPFFSSYNLYVFFPLLLDASRSKQKSFDDECIKDLLAALKEAEERMDSLERVLSEITPSGIDEHCPNYVSLINNMWLC